MTLEISNKRRQEIKDCVYDTLIKYATPTLPLKIGALIRNIPYVKLITYSSQVKKHNISYEELILDAETKDSYAVRQGCTGKYCIYYNDIDRNIVTSNRVRWNLAHELGHIVLNHHAIIGVEKLFRNGLDDKTYSYFESEANYFAQLLLVPHIVLLGLKIIKDSDIKRICKISNQALRRRFTEYKIWLNHSHENDKYDEKIFFYYYQFIYKRECKNCETGLIQRYGKHCPICGSKNTLQWGDGDKMKYPLLATLENGKLKECPNCQNEETDIDGEYCQICGRYMVNRCSNINCSNNDILPSNARYCPVCGRNSSFLNAGFLEPWNLPKIPIPQNVFDEIEDEGLPFN